MRTHTRVTEWWWGGDGGGGDGGGGGVVVVAVMVVMVVAAHTLGLFVQPIRASVVDPSSDASCVRLLEDCPHSFEELGVATTQYYITTV
jgi:hypothetical protein